VRLHRAGHDITLTYFLTPDGMSSPPEGWIPPPPAWRP
jgi:hypothetical protein